MRSFYGHIQASLFYFAKLYIDEQETQELSPNLKLYKFDAHAENKELPKTDLVGPAGFSLMNSGGLITVTTQFLISTLDDKNLFRLDDLIDLLADRLIPEDRFDLIDRRNGDRLGNIVVAEDVEIFPIERAENRPVKGIGVTLKFDTKTTILRENVSWDGTQSWDQAVLWS